MRKWFTCVILLGVVSCAESPTTPPPAVPSVEGVWTGVISGVLTPATARVTFAQDGERLTGTWSATTPAGSSSGTLAGTVTPRHHLALTLTSNNPEECPIVVGATVLDAWRITGTYSPSDCGVDFVGGLSLGREARP